MDNKQLGAIFKVAAIGAAGVAVTMIGLDVVTLGIANGFTGVLGGQEIGFLPSWGGFLSQSPGIVADVIRNGGALPERHAMHLFKGLATIAAVTGVGLYGAGAAIAYPRPRPVFDFRLRPRR